MFIEIPNGKNTEIISIIISSSVNGSGERKEIIPGLFK
jgi:hypothetical protein